MRALAVILTISVLVLGLLCTVQGIGIHFARRHLETEVAKITPDFPADMVEDIEIMELNDDEEVFEHDDWDGLEIEFRDAQVEDPIERALDRHFALRRLISAQAASIADNDYAGLFIRLQLGHEQAKRLRALLKLKAEVGANLLTQLQDPELKWKDRRQLMWQARVQEYALENSIEGMLSEEEYAAYENYLYALPQRKELAPLLAKLHAVHQDLSIEQEDAMIDLLRGNRFVTLIAEEDPDLFHTLQMLPEEREMSRDEIHIRKMMVYHDRDLDGADDILTDEQMAYYRDHIGEKEEYVDKTFDYQPTPEHESNNQAPVDIIEDEATDYEYVPRPPTPAAQSAYGTWWDRVDGSEAETFETTEGNLGFDADVSAGWGAGVTIWPGGRDDSRQAVPIDARGAKEIVARVKAPPNVTLRFGVLEDGANLAYADEFDGTGGADGEAFRHEGFVTEDGWRTYVVPLEELTLNGGYGNQAGNLTIDLQAVTGLEILVPGGQDDTSLEIDWIRFE